MTEKKRKLRDLIDEAVKSKIHAIRRFVEEVLEKIQDRNRVLS